MFVFVVEGAGREGAMERERNGMKKKTESLHRRARGNNEAARVGRCQTRLKADTWGRDPVLSLRPSLPAFDHWMVFLSKVPDAAPTIAIKS